MKRPAFQFYPADWMKDLQLRSCSIAARGLWADMLCMAHESEQYGYLVVNGKPMTDAQIINNVSGATARLLTELEAAGVFSRDGKGAIFSRRMVRDEQFRRARAEYGKLGGNPLLVNGKVNLKSTMSENEVKLDLNLPLKIPPNLKPTPSSSSSSSKNLEPLRRVEPDGFRRFWSVYPATRRRVARCKCLAAWLSQGLESRAEAIIAHVAAMSGTEQWREGYEPSPLTYLNQRRWEDGLPATAKPSRGLAL